MTKHRDQDTDYEYTRQTLYDLVEKGREGIEEMIEVAKSSEHPRAYEVLSKLIKDVGDVSDKLMTLHKNQKELNKVDAPKALEGGVTNNNLFFGSTAELQRMLIDANKTKDIVPVQED